MALTYFSDSNVSLTTEVLSKLLKRLERETIPHFLAHPKTGRRLVFHSLCTNGFLLDSNNPEGWGGDMCS